jgi:hypothetical protein
MRIHADQDPDTDPEPWGRRGVSLWKVQGWKEDSEGGGRTWKKGERGLGLMGWEGSSMGVRIVGGGEGGVGRKLGTEG